MSYANPSSEEIIERRAQLAPFDNTNEDVWLALFACILFWRRPRPASYLDLGSGTGAMVNMARKIGIEAIGVDVIAQGPGREDWFVTHDLNEPLYVHHSDYGSVAALPYDRPHDLSLEHFPLITCLEVAEHLNEESGPILCDTIARHLAPGGILIFSAAPPGQWGEHHTNTRAPHYWRSLLHERGVSFRADYTRQLSHLWDIVAGPASHWLAANVSVYDTWDGKTL